MKKHLLALAALTAFAGVAQAQSSVTLFGVFDLSARQVKNGSAGSLNSLSNGGMTSTRIGFRGVEDLGGGLRAGFWLEGGLGENGELGGAAGAAGTTAFNRRATLSLSGGFGEVRLGRDFVPDFMHHTEFDPFATTGIGNSTHTFTALNNSGNLIRANNMVHYFLPSMGGFYGSAALAMGERLALGAQGNQHRAARFGYRSGPMNVSAAYGRTKGPGNATWSRLGLGASYRVGTSTLMAQWTRGSADENVGNGQRITHYLLGAVVPVGTGGFKFSYVKSDGSGGTVSSISTRDATQLNAGYYYDLSRRTAVYAHVARLDNKGSATYVLPGGAAGIRAGENSTGMEFGVRHSF